MEQATVPTSPTILLMFLGGTPDSPNIIQHWKNMNTTFTTRDRVYLVVHPLQLPYEIHPEFASLFDPSHICIVDEEHHVPTHWGTFSLVNAELFMMQYAHYQEWFTDFFTKYILLSSTCCPIYSIDVIFHDVVADNKSIMGIQLIGDHLSQSQWMILDKQHVNLFFAAMATHTYYKTDVTKECTRLGVSKDLVKVRVKKDTEEEESVSRIIFLWCHKNRRFKCSNFKI